MERRKVRGKFPPLLVKSLDENQNRIRKEMRKRNKIENEKRREKGK